MNGGVKWTRQLSTPSKLVHQGKAVVSSEDSAIIDWAVKTTAEGRTAKEMGASEGHVPLDRIALEATFATMRGGAISNPYSGDV
jgi:hypothetical protein